ncbi:TPA: hypothetical protein JD074_15445 [Clostridioides difficile]|uniref:hypothetical protein n=1 Tax=Clostridioides difficile TaxID=1496 RepID=UPI0003B29CB4|nr:hypothetical protein [Clostridioides difficile]MBJ9771122.1 hypothetical protein [Clostridioides difficile]MCE0689580.1 hypothetical protein [Clostridioides difficile]MCE0714323.1 hypothetical protein [Clostridioides difficile]MCE0721551.1 hypothetical protein [Clostridioides difficile]MCE0731134.1 hypothetical protein [Clostridioides difficile]
MLIYDKSFYPNNIYPKINFLKIKSQLKNINYIYESDLIDCGSICIIENENYALSINSIGEISIYYNKEYKNKIQIIVDEIEQLFKSQIKNFSISKLKN